MYLISTYNKIGKAGLAMYKESKYTIEEKNPDCDAVMVHSEPLHDVEFTDKLKAIVRVGAGVNTIPVDRCTEKGVVVFNTPGGNANAVKELTIAAMIMSSRNGAKAFEWVRGLKDSAVEPGSAVEKGKEVFRGPEIMGKKLGVIGVGAIGSIMAQACHSLGMDVLGYDPYLSNKMKHTYRHFVNFTDNADDIYSTCDYITIHVPINEETKDYIGAEQIAKMKDGVYIVNYARGPVINNEAICEALKNGKVAGYSTDFPTREQLQLENVFATPHLGAGTPEADQNCAEMAARQIIDYLENGNIVNSVNMPSVSFPRADGDRITIFHKNVPGVLGTITEKVTAAGLNIENLVNKARGEIAYTILDFNCDVDEELINKLNSIQSVIRVRVI
ncbi:MAG: phosphoglycerate dehydrogenase [Clostridia bacterium]|nr:phosphoglycerate dehydrogenase [Clostridia bacterium]